MQIVRDTFSAPKTQSNLIRERLPSSEREKMREKRVEEEQLILRKEHMQIPGKGATWNSLGAITSARLPFERKNEWPGPNPALAECEQPALRDYLRRAIKLTLRRARRRRAGLS